MHTTLTLDDQLADNLRCYAEDAGIPFQLAVNRALQAGLRALETPVRPYRLQAVSLGPLRVGEDLADAIKSEPIPPALMPLADTAPPSWQRRKAEPLVLDGVSVSQWILDEREADE